MTAYLITPDYRFSYSQKGEIVSGSYESTTPTDEFVFGLTFWDTIYYIIPHSPFGPYQYTDDFSRVLIDEGLVEAQPAVLIGYTDHILQRGPRTECGPVASTNIINQTVGVLTRLTDGQNNKSTISSRSPFRPRAVFDQNTTALEVKIKRAIPIARHMDSAQSFLNWRTENGLNRRRLTSAIEQLSIRIDEAADPQSALSEFVSDLDDYFTELSAKGFEKGFNMELGDAVLRVDLSSISFRQAIHDAAAAGGLSALVLPELAAGAIAMAASLKPAVSIYARPAPLLRGSHKHFPFEMVGSMFS